MLRVEVANLSVKTNASRLLRLQVQEDQCASKGSSECHYLQCNSYSVAKPWCTSNDSDTKLNQGVGHQRHDVPILAKCLTDFPRNEKLATDFSEVTQA